MIVSWLSSRLTGHTPTVVDYHAGRIQTTVASDRDNRVGNQRVTLLAVVRMSGGSGLRILINSDILYDGDYLKGKLPQALENLCSACVETGVSIVIPGTALLEFRREQAKRVHGARGRIDKACRTLDEFGISHDRAEPQKLVGEPDLLSLLKRTGVEAQAVEPDFQDLSEAHRRACLHEAPQPAETQHDEMRDLAIWMVAVRIAQQDGGAILLSRDEIHLHGGGDQEAASVGLTRARDIGAALELLNVETPAGLLVRQLMAPVWDDLIEAGFPLSSPMHLQRISDASFVQGAMGLASGRFAITAKASVGKWFRASVEMSLTEGVMTSLSMTDVAVDDKQWGEGPVTITPNKAVSSATSASRR